MHRMDAIAAPRSAPGAPGAGKLLKPGGSAEGPA